MAEDLQGLLQRINDEGMKKIDAEREAILAEAKKKAHDLVQQAKEERERLIDEGKRESAKLMQAGEDKLRQAARDVVISLESEIKQITTGLVKGAVGEALTPAFLADLVVAIGQAYAGRAGRPASVEVLVPAAQLDQFAGGIKEKLGQQFRNGVTITPVPNLDAGVQVSFDGESVFHDFSDDAITQMLCAYANPRVVELLQGAKE